MKYNTQISQKNNLVSSESVVSIDNISARTKADFYTMIVEQTGNHEIAGFIDSQINLSVREGVLFLEDEKVNALEEISRNVRAVVNLKPLNRVRNVKKYLLSLQKLIPDAGLFLGCVETYDDRRARFKNMFKSIWRPIYIFDFLLNRVFPRILVLEKIYSFFTNNSYHVLSKAEVLGRLVYSGFDIVDFKVIAGMLYYVAMNTHEPSDKPVSIYPFVKLRRVGKNGEMLGVYKLRTMHPYSEYLQSYIVKLNGYNEVGKPANDFRLTSWGKFLRKVWLDEIPQFINVLLGQMKLVGVRPLSKVRFEELPRETQKARIRHKPGCFPPYVSLNMPDAEQNIEAEVIYMKEYEENPYTTDIKYLYKALFNIITNKIRSS